MKRFLLFLISCSLFLYAEAALGQTSTVKLMCWNLLNYPDVTNISADTTLRNPFYRTVVQYENPDILVTEEVTSAASTTWFLNDVMNINGPVYQKGAFINGYDTDNEIYFRDSLFTFISNTRIKTEVRDINGFKLVHKVSGDTIVVYAVHLKASSGSANELERAMEVDSLRKVTNQLSPGSNFVVCGDFNFYGDYESAYQKLLLDNLTDDGNFVDPITLTGVWNQYAYRAKHTQSTRTASFGGGSTGGLDDRFDMILFSSAINTGANGISYVAGSTTPIGNDGNHYGHAIYLVPNTAAPSGVINALYNASDHLPVYALFNFSDPNGIESIKNSPVQLSVYPNPISSHTVLKYKIAQSSRVSIRVFDVLGKEVSLLVNENKTAGEYEIPLTLPDCLESGFYFIHLQSNEITQSIRFIRY